ncbi:MAG: hypothetical protein ACT4PZ_05210 [Panacagrimonas sp.]
MLHTSQGLNGPPFALAPQRLAKVFCIALSLTASSVLAAEVTSESAPTVGQDPMAQRYELGHGLRLGNSGFTLGGYGEATARDADGSEPAQLALDTLSAILWWDGGGRWHFFSEAEIENALIVRRGDTSTDRLHVISERFYFDYARADALKFRIGKFLTPVGRWNLIHAAPLTWTTSRPLITEATFPTNATGAMVYGVLPWTADGVEYSLYASPGEEIFPEPGLDTFSEAAGGRIAATLLPHTQFGLSYVNFEQEETSDQRKHLVDFDFAWTFRRFELSGEFAYRTIRGDEETQDEQGAYVQLVAPLSEKLFGVVRYESFRDSAASRDLSLYLGGLNYRFAPGLVLKAEYSRATDNPFGVADGFLASFAVLF